jgi:hypothetical protein
MQQEDQQIVYLEQAIFRANAAYELLLFENLAHELQASLRALYGDEELHALLHSRQHPAIGIKALDRDAASLFLALQSPGPIPSSARSQLGEDYHKTILALVFDQILEVAWYDTWLSGMAAYEVFHTQQPQHAPQGAIARLSLEALKYAQVLALHDSRQLSMRLYCYNRLPLSPYWQRKFPTSDSVAEYLGLHSRGSSSSQLQQQWVETAPAASSDAWFSWSARHVQAVSAASSSSPFIYKLYISPDCEYIRDVFQTTIAVLVDEQITGFKIGKDVYGLLRPDKFVVYFASLDACQHTADVLQQKLAGIPVHGVPFSAEFAGHGLLSWGIDPPSDQQAFSGLPGESWRLWVTNRLATALLTARAGQSASTEPWQFALARLRLDGVDTESWTPPQEHLHGDY